MKTFFNNSYPHHIHKKRCCSSITHSILVIILIIILTTISISSKSIFAIITKHLQRLYSCNFQKNGFLFVSVAAYNNNNNNYIHNRNTYTRNTLSSSTSRFLPPLFSRYHDTKNNYNQGSVIIRRKTRFPSSASSLLFRSNIRLLSTSTTTTTTGTMTSSNDLSDDRMFKRVKLDNDDNIVSTKVIGTHSGTFQADEAMGCWMIRQLPEYKNSKIIRTRDLTILDTLDIVLDVGGIYDHSKLKYDHHQRDYDEKFDVERCTKLSASGLIYKHYGQDIIQQLYPHLSNEYVMIAYNKLYDNLLEALDAIDTGVEMAPSPDIKLLYKDNTGLSARVSRLNPRWNELIDETTGEEPNPDKRFEQAMILCGNDFMSVLIGIVESYLPARKYVDEAIQKRYDIHESGQILCFPSGGLPWQSHLYDLEKQYNLMNDNQLIKFVLYTDQSNMWRIQAVTIENAKFTNRLSLPEPWLGLRDNELSTVSNIPGCRFVHANGFIGGNDTYEGVLQMANIALTFPSTTTN